MLNLKEYTLEIFETGNLNNNLDIQVSRDMFLTNVREGKEVFKSLDTLDFKELKTKWNKMTVEQQEKAIKKYATFVKKYKRELLDAFLSKDIDKFNQLLHTPTLLPSFEENVSTTPEPPIIPEIPTNPEPPTEPELECRVSKRRMI